LVLIYY